MNPVNQQLLLVKYLYQRGEAALSEKGTYSAGMAVSLFQDAVESLAWTIAKEVDADITERGGFEGYWEAIKLGRKNLTRKELPPKAKMRDLNKARVNFKHYGIVPAVGEAAKLQVYAEQFLAEACTEFFGVGFKSLSLVDLIINPTIAQHLRIAQEAVDRNDAKGALERCALAYRYLTETVDLVLPPISPTRYWSDLLTDPKEAKEIPSEEARLRQIESTVTTLRNFSLANALRIPLDDFLRFKRVIPDVARAKNELVVWWIDESTVGSLADAKFAVGYLTDFALALEQTLAGVALPTERQPPLSPLR